LVRTFGKFGLEAFSRNLTHGSFSALTLQSTEFAKCANRWFAHLANSVDGNVNAEKLPCVRLRLNASKPESMLKNTAIILVVYRVNTYRALKPQDHNMASRHCSRIQSCGCAERKFKYSTNSKSFADDLNIG